MKEWKRLFLFLLLNVLVSACTTFAVLIFWDRTQDPLPRGLISLELPQLGAETPAVDATPEGPELTAEPTPTRAFVAYQVQAGDEFDSIANLYGVCVEELMAENGFTTKALGVGEVLRVPAKPLAGVRIESVIGAGDLESEHLLLKHCGEGELSLVGWRLEDQDGNQFVFPQFPELILYKNGAVNVFTKAGTNSVVDLYWGLDSPVWESGETVVLRDAENTVRAQYVLP